MSRKATTKNVKKKQVKGGWQLKKVDLASSIEYHVSNGTQSASTLEGCCDLLNAQEETIRSMRDAFKSLYLQLFVLSSQGDE